MSFLFRCIMVLAFLHIYFTKPYRFKFKAARTVAEFGGTYQNSSLLGRQQCTSESAASEPGARYVHAICVHQEAGEAYTLCR